MGVKHVAGCFVCSKDNPFGLKAKFDYIDGIVRGEFTPNEHHQGPHNLLHGGLITTLLDEAMSALIVTELDVDAATASLEVRFKKPAPINEKIIIEAELLNRHKKMNTAFACARKEDGTVIAEATGKFLSR